MRPRETASASLPRRPLVSMWVMTPFLMCSMRGQWQSVRLDAARVRFLMPIFAIWSTTMLTTKSPFLKWWWKEMVMPSLRPERLIASSSEGRTFLLCFWRSSKRSVLLTGQSAGLYSPWKAETSLICGILVISIVRPPQRAWIWTFRKGQAGTAPLRRRACRSSCRSGWQRRNPSRSLPRWRP